MGRLAMQFPSDAAKPHRPPPAGRDTEAARRILSLSPFDALPGSSREAFLELAKVERLPRRAVLMEQGEPAKAFVVLGSGRIKLERLRAGRILALGHRGPGETIGETALGASAIASESASVVDEAEALVLGVPALRRLMASDAAVRLGVAELLDQRRQHAERRLESLLLHGVEVRLLEFLATALDRWAEPHPVGELINAPFTHADIALLIGSTRETVTLMLGKLKRAGVIEFDRRRIVIRDRAALARRGGAG
jgi:CRP-like cAMP-binding protein